MIDKTLCEHCVFSIIDKGVQTGCKLNRVSKLPHHVENGLVVIDTYCATCRNVYWKNSQTSIDDGFLEKTVMDEVQTQFSVVIVCPDDFTEEELSKSVDSVLISQYKNIKTHIIINATTDNKNKAKAVVSKTNNNFEFIFSYETDEKLKLYQLISKLNSSYICFLALGQELDSSILYDINVSVNIDMAPKLTYTSNDMYICPLFMYKHFINSTDTIKSINEYVKSIAKNNSINSQP